MSKPRWTQEEVDLLRKYYSTADLDYLKQLFPNRSYESILHKANRLRLKRVNVKHYLDPRSIPDLPIEKQAYIAGITDGEGTITISFRRGGTKTNIMPSMSPMIIITNTDRALIDYLHPLLSGSTIKTGKETKKRKATYAIQVARLLDVEGLLTQILPYLIVKRRQAELVLEYCSLRKQDTMLSYNDRLFQIAKEVRELNKKGPTS